MLSSNRSATASRLQDSLGNRYAMQKHGRDNAGLSMPSSMPDQIHAEVRAMIGQSRLTRNSQGMALIQRNELHVKELLGRGAFSEVHEVKIIPRPGRNFTVPLQTSYAMKHVKARLLAQPDNFRLAAAELAIEAHMLASFDHPNVMKIRGWAANGVASFADGRHDSFFLLLDKLDETLDSRITTWQRMLEHESVQKQQIEQQLTQYRQQRQQQGLDVSDMWQRLSISEEETMDDPRLRHQIRQSLNRQRNVDPQLAQYQQFQQQNLHRYESLQLEKFGICVEIASALAYLHDVGVIFRDLKPNNIGFLNGRVQLFDFGLSRELPALNLVEPFEMSGKVGTLRYMAVEVASHDLYNVAADVYSWAMVCYEIFTLQKPFAGWTREMHTNLVCGRGIRPEFPTTNTTTEQVAPSSVKHLLEVSWDQNPVRRPTMKVAEHKMRQLEEQQLFKVCSLETKTNRVASQSFNAKHQSFSPMQIQIMRQQQQLQQAQQYGNQVVELPRDFAVDGRKAPGRNHSETYATSATTMSNVSTQSSDFAVHMNNNN